MLIIKTLNKEYVLTSLLRLSQILPLCQANSVFFISKQLFVLYYMLRLVSKIQNYKEFRIVWHVWS